MSPIEFDDFFQTATGNSPYDYQCRFCYWETPLRAEVEHSLSKDHPTSIR